jgi:hypothetical protein
MKASFAFAAAATIAQAIASPSQLTARAGSVPVVSVTGNGMANAFQSLLDSTTLTCACSFLRWRLPLLHPWC